MALTVDVNYAKKPPTIYVKLDGRVVLHLSRGIVGSFQRQLGDAASEIDWHGAQVAYADWSYSMGVRHLILNAAIDGDKCKVMCGRFPPDGFGWRFVPVTTPTVFENGTCRNCLKVWRKLKADLSERSA